MREVRGEFLELIFLCWLSHLSVCRLHICCASVITDEHSFIIYCQAHLLTKITLSVSQVDVNGHAVSTGRCGFRVQHFLPLQRMPLRLR